MTRRDDPSGARGAICPVQASGVPDLFFYDELPPAEREQFARHRRQCPACRDAVEELALIRDALAAQPVVAAPAAGDWSGFMSRLSQAIASDTEGSTTARVAPFAPRPAPAAGGRVSYRPLLAMAALLALVTMSVLFVARARDNETRQAQAQTRAEVGLAAGDPAVADGASLSAVSQLHLERSKLVLLGLASKDGEQPVASDWAYERELASRLLTDTRLYRMAAEDRGLDTLAEVMRDLELVLLQASMSEGADPAALSQIQRAIRKRDLLQKMDVVRTSRGT